MSRDVTYLGLLAELRQDELLSEAKRRRRASGVIRDRRHASLGDRLRTVLARPRASDR
ncbi:MAG TPA: hypothetical protein VFH63_09490 [candidate division Zixibacteria bacterium]|nr:hypothetical protein [candidate division Zixibacteria bacterium]